MENPHISDDFHRFLIEYVREGYPVKDLKEGTDGGQMTIYGKGSKTRIVLVPEPLWSELTNYKNNKLNGRLIKYDEYGKPYENMVYINGVLKLIEN